MLKYTEYGQGPLVVLIHGLAGTGEQHFASLIPNLKTEYHIIALDLRGHGASRDLALPQAQNWFFRHTNDVAELIEQLNAGPAHVIGYSDGAEIGVLLAARYPELVVSVTGWGISGRIPPLPVVEVYGEPEHRIPDWENFRQELIDLHGPEGPNILKVWAKSMAYIHVAGGEIIGPLCANVRCSVLIITGDRDPFNPLLNVQTLVECLPNSDLIVLAGAAHDLLAERPTEMVTLIRRMLHTVTQ